MEKTAVQFDLSEVNGKDKNEDKPTINLETGERNIERPLSRISKLFSDGGSISSCESDASDDEFGIKPLKSNYLTHQSRPGTALASKKRPNLTATAQVLKKRLKVIRTIKKELHDNDITWIKHSFVKKDCTTYISENGKCHCGRSKDLHPNKEQNAQTSSEWSDVKHCSMLPTDAFGVVKLLKGSYNTARYLRLSNDSDCDDILQLLRDFWHLSMPGIILSIIGSGNTVIPHKLYQTIQRDIAKVGKLTRAWVLTDGLSCGSSGVIGHMLSTHGYPVPAIAFGHWGSVKNSDSLRNPDEDPSIMMHYDPESSEYSLDPNHTHLLLVDDGMVKDTKCNDSLRRDFEKYLLTQFNIPLLYNMIGGTEEDGKMLHSILEGGGKVVMVKGSGGFADDYCDFHKHYEDQQDLPIQCTCFQMKPCKKIIEKMDHDFDIHILTNVWKNRKSVSIYDYTQVSDYDAFILKLLVSTTQNTGIDHQLDMACKWSRVDVAEHILSEQLDATTGAKYSDGLTKTLFHALVWGYADFCGVLIENGADIYDIQSNILSLYESAYFSPRCNHVIQLLEKYSTFDGNSKIQRHQVNQLLELLFDKGFVACTGYESDPFFELTLWAILMLRDDLAVLLWRYTQDPVRCCLVALLMLYSFKHKVYLEKDDDRRRVKMMYDVFEDLAISVMNQAWLSDPDMCRKAMLSKWQRIRCYNYLDLAFHAHARAFMAHPACQEIISAGWRGQFKRDTSFVRVLLIILLPFLCVTPLVPFDRRVSYRRAIQGRYKMIYIDKLTGVEAMYNRAVAFYSAPVTKFWMNLLFYSVFLVFHSYNLLNNMLFIDPFDFSKLAWTEKVVWIWLAMAIISELQDWVQSCMRPSTKLKYLTDSWNRMDILILTLYVIGIVFRMVPSVKYFLAGRTILAVTSVPLFCKLLMLFEYKPTLGPILLMLREMCKDLGVFLLLLVIFLLGFGVSYIAILIPPAKFSWQSMSALFMYPYFQMFGDFYLEVFELAEDSAYIDKEWNKMDPEPDAMITKAQGIVSVALLVMWVMISTVVLVNLLIAMFSDTYRTIKDNQLVIWKYQRYKMLSQYRASMIPPPFNLIHYFLRFLVKCCRRISRGGVRPERDQSPYYWKDCMIRTFMQDARDEYLSVTDSQAGDASSDILQKLQKVEHHLSIIRRVGNKTSSLYA